MSENSSSITVSKPLGLGTWLSIGSPVIAELASSLGFDWLLFDLEHGTLTEATLLANLQAVRNRTTALIVRVGNLDTALIARVLDWGASGIMLPHVSTPEQAEACVAAMRFPPRGHRGFSSSARTFGYGLEAPADLQTIQQPLLFAQIEDLEGVNNAEAIAQVEGVNVLFVGPADLRLDLSTRPPATSISYAEAVERVSSSAQKYGKQAGILVRDPADLPALRQAGYSCLAINSDLAILRTGFQAILKV